ncbi:MAG: sulfatase-like hydrolase/transferase [Acidobacteriota bacterium]|nr:sulfatase-like hydrolase/transferase [Acidobacteriota bacterium]
MRTLFVSLDTLCATRLSCLGSTTVHTPNLDAFASDAAVFRHTFATDIPTQPSHTALFTGRSGISTGIVSHFHPPACLDEDVSWMPSVFQSSGYRTAAVDHLFSMKQWFIRGYDDYMVPPGRSRSPASVIRGMAEPWLDAHRDEDFFLFLHFWDAHIPYVPPEPFKSIYTGPFVDRLDVGISDKLMSRPSYPLFKRNLYDHLDRLPNLEYIEALHHAEIAYLDHELGGLFNRLDDLGILDDMMIVVFGDHGEIMTDHDAWFDHAGLYDSVVRVPLMIRAPGVVPPMATDALVGLIDVAPTIYELLGPELATGTGLEVMEGRSLVPLMEGRADHHREAVYLSECTWQAKRGVRTAEWKYIRCWDPGIYPRNEPELYHLPTDPDEQVNLARLRPDVVSALDSRLEGWLAAGLDARPDPMLEVVSYGLPAVARLRAVIEEEQAESVAPLIDLRSRAASPARGGRPRIGVLGASTG